MLENGTWWILQKRHPAVKQLEKVCYPDSKHQGNGDLYQTGALSITYYLPQCPFNTNNLYFRKSRNFYVRVNTRPS